MGEKVSPNQHRNQMLGYLTIDHCHTWQLIQKKSEHTGLDPKLCQVSSDTAELFLLKL